VWFYATLPGIKHSFTIPVTAGKGENIAHNPTEFGVVGRTIRGCDTLFKMNRSIARGARQGWAANRTHPIRRHGISLLNLTFWIVAIFKGGRSQLLMEQLSLALDRQESSLATPAPIRKGRCVVDDASKNPGGLIGSMETLGVCSLVS
jgi:hypothetical protein